MQKHCTWSHGTIHYKLVGKGTPVLLLHGFGEDSSIWNEQIKALENNCLLIVPDLPGTGASEWNNVNSKGSMANPSLFTIDQLSESVYAILQNEHISQCYLLGHSMGGYITLAYAKKYSTTLKGFGLIHSTAFADSEEKKRTAYAVLK